MTNKKAISKTKSFWITGKNKKAISKDPVLTIGFIILAVMAIMIGTNLVAPLVKNTLEYNTFSVAKTVDAVIASSENMVVTIDFTKSYVNEEGAFGLGLAKDTRGVAITIDGNKICMCVADDVAKTPLACYKFNEDNSLKTEVKKDKFIGKMTIEKKEGKLIFR